MHLRRLGIGVGPRAWRSANFAKRALTVRHTPSEPWSGVGIPSLRSVFRDANLVQEAGSKHIRTRGWVASCRRQKRWCFLTINDGTCANNLQVVFESHQVPAEVRMGACVEVEGDLVPSPARGQSIEMQGKSLHIVGHCDESYPLQKKAHSTEFLRTQSHLRGRSAGQSAMLRVRHAASEAIHDCMKQLDFVYVHAPVITPSDCEGAGEMFQLSTGGKEDSDVFKDFFTKPAFLSVSGQFYAEAFSAALSSVYTFGPTFRAEKSGSSRHLSEFWMVEPEVAHATLDDIVGLAERCVKHTVRHCLEECGDDVNLLGQHQHTHDGVADRLQRCVDEPFAILSYTEAIDVLQRRHQEQPFRSGAPQWGDDLSSEYERFLAEEYCQRCVFVTDYPASLKPFYMKLSDDQRTVRCMDLLVPGVGELIGGSEREEDVHVMERRLREKGIDVAEYEWYLDLRRYGSFPHAGFGLGFERLVQFVTGYPNIRDCIPVPRHEGQSGLVI